MNNNGVTLIELLIVIIVLGIISAFSVISVANIVENTSIKADAHNAEVLEESVLTAYEEGVIIIKNNRLYNTVSKRAYSGTGSWFFEDMDPYLDIRVRPQSKVAANPYNVDGDKQYKFWFTVRGRDVDLFYYDENRDKVILNTFTLD